MGQLLSCVRDMDLWELFHSLFTFLCMLLDSKMAAEAGTATLVSLVPVMRVCVSAVSRVFKSV